MFVPRNFNLPEEKDKDLNRLIYPVMIPVYGWLEYSDTIIGWRVMTV